jgi:methionyl-tRNA formyltransferase
VTPRSEAELVGSPARVVFFGSGPFGVPILEALAGDPRVRVAEVVSTPPRPAGRSARPRPTPVAERARALGLPVLEPDRLRDPEVVNRLGAGRPALGVLADFGRIVPPALLAVPERGILNVHPSRLPRHRGASPIQATIAAGDAEAGVTIIRMDEGIDTGPIVAAEAWPLGGRERAPELEAEAARRGAALLLRTIGPWLARRIPEVPQDEASATVTRTLRREDGRLDPSLPAARLERATRANEPWPGSFFETPLGRVIVHRASVAAARAGDEPGAIVVEGRTPALATPEGRLVLEELQLAGRRTMPGDELLRGQPRLAGARVARAEATAGRGAAT